MNVYNKYLNYKKNLLPYKNGTILEIKFSKKSRKKFYTITTNIIQKRVQ